MDRLRTPRILGRTTGSGIALAAVVAAGLSGCAAEESAAADGTVQVGVLSSYTGPLAIYGPAWEQGFRAGLEQLTDGSYEVDGTKIDIEVKDDAGDPATGLTAAKELIGEGIDVLVGTASSSVAVPVAQTAAENDVVSIAGAASTPEFNAMAPGVFRSSLDVKTVNNAVLEVAKKSGGKRIGYIGQDYAYGQDQAAALAAQAKGVGLTVEPNLLPVSTKDFTAGVAKVLASGVDTIYVGWTGEGLAQLFQALVAQGAFDADSPVNVTSLAPAPEEFETVASAVGDEALANFQLVSVYAEDTTVIALVFPSLYVIGRTRYEQPARRLGAGIALAASTAWILDRTGVLANPLAGVEDAVVTHPWWVVATIGAVAALLYFLDRRHLAAPSEVGSPVSPSGGVEGARQTLGDARVRPDAHQPG